MPKLAVGEIDRLGDAELVCRAQKGEKDCFVLLLDRHRPMVRAVVGRMIGRGNLVDDVLQEAAVEALVGLAGLRVPDRFGAWLCGIAVNVTRSWLRQAAREPLVADLLGPDVWAGESLADRGPGPEESALLAEQARGIDDALAELAPGQRAALILFYLEDRSVVQTASALGIAPGAVRTRLHAGRSTLRHLLEPTTKEPLMTSDDDGQLITMRVLDVRREMDRDKGLLRRHVIVLEELHGTRTMPVWVGRFEATQIAFALQGQTLPRPLTYAFMHSLLDAGGVALSEVRITALTDHTFYAEAAIRGAAGESAVDARPSDAINLALLADAPIRVSSAVLDSCQEQTLIAATAYPDTSAEIVSEAKQQFVRAQEELVRSIAGTRGANAILIRP